MIPSFPSGETVPITVLRGDGCVFCVVFFFFNSFILFLWRLLCLKSISSKPFKPGYFFCFLFAYLLISCLDDPLRFCLRSVNAKICLCFFSLLHSRATLWIFLVHTLFFRILFNNAFVKAFHVTSAPPPCMFILSRNSSTVTVRMFCKK